MTLKWFDKEPRTNMTVGVQAIVIWTLKIIVNTFYTHVPVNVNIEQSLAAFSHHLYRVGLDSPTCDRKPPNTWGLDQEDCCGSGLQWITPCCNYALGWLVRLMGQIWHGICDTKQRLEKHLHVGTCFLSLYFFGPWDCQVKKLRLTYFGEKKSHSAEDL